MTSWTTRFLAGAAVVAAAVAAICPSPAFAQNPPLVVGAALSQSGALADLGGDYRKGLLLWQEEVNAAGGLLGRPVELRLVDDGSEAVRAGPLYQQLIKNEKADLLIGPMGSAATLIAAAEAESARRVMVNGAGPSRAIHKRSPRFVFQAPIPYAAYGAGVLEMAKEQGFRKLFIIARDDPVAVEMATATRDAALALGLQPADVDVHNAGLADFALHVAKAHALQADAWIAFGEVRDAAEMIKSFKRLGYAPRLFFARAASDPKLIPFVGQDAEFALGALAYDARLATPANDRFVKAYTARWSAKPTLAAAEGYAAGTVLGEAVRRAGSAEQDKVRAVLAAEAIPTVLGEYKVNPKTGEQAGAVPALTQILKGRPEVVWPRALETGKPVLPYPQWSERPLLK